MSERIAPPLNALPQQKPDRVLPLRPARQAIPKAAVGDPPLVPSSDKDVLHCFSSSKPEVWS